MPMKKENLKSSIIIGLIVIFSLSATYAFLNLSANNGDATGTGGCFNVSYTAQNISNASLKSSITYSEGATTTVTLSKDSSCKVYTESEIYLHTDLVNTTTDFPFSNGAFKYRVEKSGTMVSEGVVSSGETDVILATVPLTDTKTEYKIYIWIDSSLSKGAYNDKSYSGYIYAKSTQTSTVK